MNNLKFIKTAFILSFGLLLTLSSEAKTKFKAGYFVQAGDTFQGYIEHKDWKQSPSFIRFKTSPEEEARIFSPLDVDFYVVSNHVYVGQVVKVETSSKDDLALGSESALQFRNDTVFVEEVFKGDKSLYLYTDNNREKHLYINQDNQLDLLVHKKYIAQNSNGDQVVRHNNSYQNQLIEYFGSCSAMFDEVVNTKYDVKSMINTFHSYNKCEGNTPKLNKRKPQKV
jgi:hypothetical protein